MSISSNSINDDENNISDFGGMANSEYGSLGSGGGGDDIISELSSEPDRANQQNNQRGEDLFSGGQFQGTEKFQGGYSRDKQRKRDLLIKLHELKKSGCHLTGTFNTESPLDDLEAEYTRQLRNIRHKSATAFAKKGLVLTVFGMETFLSPLSEKVVGQKLYLDGLSDNVDPDDYEDILSELAEKYTSDQGASPEVRLAFGLATSVAMVHMNNLQTNSETQKQPKKKQSKSRLMSSSTFSSVEGDDDDDMDEINEPDFSSFIKPTPEPEKIIIEPEIKKTQSNKKNKIETSSVYSGPSTSSESSFGSSNKRKKKNIINI